MRPGDNVAGPKKKDLKSGLNLNVPIFWVTIADTPPMLVSPTLRENMCKKLTKGDCAKIDTNPDKTSTNFCGPATARYFSTMIELTSSYR